MCRSLFAILLAALLMLTAACQSHVADHDPSVGGGSSLSGEWISGCRAPEASDIFDGLAFGSYEVIVEFSGSSFRIEEKMYADVLCRSLLAVWSTSSSSRIGEKIELLEGVKDFERRSNASMTLTPKSAAFVTQLQFGSGYCGSRSWSVGAARSIADCWKETGHPRETRDWVIKRVASTFTGTGPRLNFGTRTGTLNNGAPAIDWFWRRDLQQ